MKWNYKYLSLSLISTILICLIHVPFPFFGDQAFFLLGAREINDGFVLYRDFWDIKQPGIFFFFLIAGKMFGFTEVGIHTFEMLYWLAFSLVLLWFLKKTNFLRTSSLIYLAPVMVVGSYYAFGNIRQFTQIEALINFPLLLVIIFNFLFMTDKKRKIFWLFCSGVSGGLILFFKLIFAPIIFFLWIYLLFKYYSINKPLNIKIIIKYLMVVVSGIFLFWLPFIIYCKTNSLFGLCYDTFVVYPWLIFQNVNNRQIIDLFYAFKDYVFNLLFIIPLMILSFFIINKKKFLVNSFWVWFCISVIIILIQKTSWYIYHFQMLYTPIIVLALLSIDFIINRLKYLKPVRFFYLKTILLLTVNLFAVTSVSLRLYKLKNYNFAFSEQNRKKFILSRLNNETAYRISQYINSKNEINSPIFVAYDPLIYYYTNRYQSTSQSGWSMQLFIPEQYEILLKELKNKPPRYIFIHTLFENYFYPKGAPVLKWIKQNYVIDNTGKEGIWYRISGNTNQL